MTMFGQRLKHASMVWLEARRVHAGGQFHPFSGAAEELARILGNLPMGPTAWVVDDAWVPTLLLRDIVELPPGTEAREAFFRWRYGQDLALEAPQFVQALAMEENTWLLAGMPQQLRDEWVQLASVAGRPMRLLQPRWLWLYNRLAATREVPGMLLSLSAQEQGRYTGTLAAWGRNLILLRQWNEPADPDAWCQERVLPTIAYLQRDARSPLELHLWGATQWPDCGLPVRMLQPEIPAEESL
jgi:hypothetical protein